MFLKCPAATPSRSASVSRSSVDSDCQYDLKVMPHYHQKVTTKATPFREFTKRCLSDEIGIMEDIQKLRRDRLRSYIKENAKSVNAFAMALGRQASFFSDLLRGEKSFREKLVEKLEAEVSGKGWPPIGLTNLAVDQSKKVVPLVRPWPFSCKREEFDRLPELQRVDINARIATLVEINEAAIGVAEKRARSRKKSN